MPKLRKRLYELGRFWLVPPDEKYWDYGISWNDKSARQTRRVGTERTDFEAAKIAIHKHALEHGDGSHQDELLLVTLQRYYLSYAKDIPAAKNVTVTIKFVTEHIAGTMVSEFLADVQRDFVRKLREHGLADNTIARHFTDIFSALGYAVQFNHLSKFPARLAKRFWGERTQPRSRKSIDATKRALTMEEWGRIFDVCARGGEDGVRMRYLILQLGTIGRPSAVIEVTGQQIDLVNGILDLNPPGREQNKKRRPKIPICETFAKWLTAWNVPGEQHCLLHRAKPIATRNFIRKVIREAKVPNCNPYTFRHSISSWLAWRGVSKWERKKAMGHAKIDGGSTDTYTHFDPTYLRSVAVALEELFQAIAPHTRFNLLRTVIEDQGAPEALWAGIPRALFGLTSLEIVYEAEKEKAAQEDAGGQAVPASSVRSTGLLGPTHGRADSRPPEASADVARAAATDQPEGHGDPVAHQSRPEAGTLRTTSAPGAVQLRGDRDRGADDATAPSLPCADGVAAIRQSAEGRPLHGSQDPDHSRRERARDSVLRHEDTGVEGTQVVAATGPDGEAARSGKAREVPQVSEVAKVAQGLALPTFSLSFRSGEGPGAWRLRGKVLESSLSINHLQTGPTSF